MEIMLPDILQRYRAQVDEEMISILDSHPSPLYDMLRYHMGYLDTDGKPNLHSHGKALRSSLCLMACEAFRGEVERALPAAAAIELVHNFSLIHDDIQDGDRERRHRPTVWVVYGKAQAINAGMAMRVLANVSLMRLQVLGVPAGIVLQALALLDETSLRLIEGQYLDISFEQRQDIGTAEYLAMVKLKTAALIASAVELGAILVAEDHRFVQPLINFGTNLGYAFQLRDDTLGIWGNQDSTGKPVGNDILRKKKSFPIVYAWENTSENQKKELVQLFLGDPIDEKGKDRILQILEDAGARSHSQHLIEGFCQAAVLEIERLQVSPTARAGFVELVEFLNHRDF